jgi:CheY-like chemotaxis protein
LKPLINEALILLRASLPSTIEIRSDLHNDGALVLADATQMHQVIMNLCTNAAHAMESGGGVMTVGLKKHRLTSNEETLGRGLAPGTYVEIVVQDTGHGISASVKKRIFEPYFTTKAPGKGTGMGLAVVHGIIKGHGGAINVHSEPGTGSRFSILLPTTERAIPISRVKISALPRGDESLLFVDDEAFLVDLGRQMLTRLGYRVTCSTNPLDALEALRREPQRFDLLITDMTMPHMTGEILARQCRIIRPDLPAILCTGYSRQIETERFGQLGFASLLMKPLTIGDLARTIRKALDGRNGSREMGSAFINEIHQGQAPAVNE